MPPTESQTILALSIGDDTVASSRVRVGSVLQWLEGEGWEITRVTARRRLWPVTFLARLITQRPTVTLIQKVVPPPWYSRLVARFSKRIVFECDDAIHLPQGGEDALAGTTTRRLQILLPLCNRVVVSNNQLREDLRDLGAADPVTFPGPAPTSQSSAPGDMGRSGVLWLGSPSTYQNVLTTVVAAMDLLPSCWQLTIVGAPRDRSAGQVQELVWSFQREAAALGSARVGVAPQPEDDWSRRKAFFKVLEYLAAGVVPVVPPQPAVELLLGDELRIVAVTTSDDTPPAWAAAIKRAADTPVDQEWLAARDRVFERWSTRKLGQTIVSA